MFGLSCDGDGTKWTVWNWLLLGVALLTSAGCSPSSSERPMCYQSLVTESALSAGSGVWQTIAEPLLDAEGVSEEVQLSTGSSDSVVLRVSAPQDAKACVQLHSVSDENGVAWVTPPTLIADYGSYCQSCPQRVSVGVGGGVYVLPSIDPAPTVTGTMRVRAALRDCATFLPYRSAAGRPDRLRIEQLVPPAVNRTSRGEIWIEFVILPGSFLSGDESAFPTPLREAVDQINTILSPGSLAMTPLRIRRTASADPLELKSGDLSAIASLVDSLKSCQHNGERPRSQVLPIVLAGCIRNQSQSLMITSEPEGYVAHIPDGVITEQGPYGVYLSGRTCRENSTPFVLTSGELAKRIAHELGHALGLYHTVESDGTTDQLADTSSDNLMNFRPSVVAGLGSGFTTNQLAVMRRHPLIRWQ